MIPFFHISSCLAESTFPPESGTMLQRWERCFQNTRIRPRYKGCLSSFPYGQHCPDWALSWLSVSQENCLLPSG